MASANQQQQLSPLQSVAIGGLVGGISESIVMPATVVRTRLMVQGAGSSNSHAVRQYRGFFDAASTMLRHEGIGSFYKGALVNLGLTPLARGFYMLGVELSKTYVGEGTAAKDFCAGMAGQLVGSLVFVPKDIVVERCAIDGQLTSQVGSSASSLRVLATIAKHEGAAGFFRAFLPHQYVFIPFNGLTMTLAGKGREAGAAVGLDPSAPTFGVANTFASAAAAALATTPIDVVKTRIQVQGANPSLFAYAGPLDCAAQIVRKEGALALFAGASGRILYLAPKLAMMLPMYDVLKKALFKQHGV